MSLLGLSERILRGEAAIEDHHPFAPSNEIEEVAAGTAFVLSFANVSVFATGAGLCLVDTGSAFAAGPIHDAVRTWSPAPVETADHTWVWVPDGKVLFTGDLIIWCTPNAGNPQKVQRYAAEWAVALRTMADLGAEVLLPGHGLPIAGADTVRAVLTDTAELLESLETQTLALMNDGARLDDVLHTVEAPAQLLDKPYLRPIYDDPEFVVRNIWRLYGGWYDGNPASLKPAPDAALAAELAALAGGPARLAGRAVELADAGDLRLAGHLAEMAALAAPEDRDVHAARADVYERRAQAEPSLMAKGVFRWAAAESKARSGEIG